MWARDPGPQNPHPDLHAARTLQICQANSSRRSLCRRARWRCRKSRRQPLGRYSITNRRLWRPADRESSSRAPFTGCIGSLKPQLWKLRFMGVNGLAQHWERVEAGLKPLPELPPPLTRPIADSAVLDDEVTV